MVWVKAEISDGVNREIETIQERKGCSKPEAIAMMLESYTESHTLDGSEWEL
jgi:hypothetical protein